MNRLIAISIVLVALSGCYVDNSADKSSTAHAEALTASLPAHRLPRRGAPREVRGARAEWPLPNRDYEGTRATFDTKLSRANVSSLTEAWSLDLPPRPDVFYGSATASALVLDHIVYYADQVSNVYALDLSSGEMKWQTRYDAANGGPNGVAVGWGKLFAMADDRTFVALDLTDGTELWRAALDLPPNAGLGVAPVAYDGLVYLSSQPGNETSDSNVGVNGTLYAVDQRTGAVTWSFATIEDSTLWGHPEINGAGGAWYPPTIDESTSTIYFGIGNAFPLTGNAEYPNGSSRLGSKLYLNSVLSLAAQSGELKWYFQEAPEELFDHDFQNPPIVVDVPRPTDVRRLVIGSGKTGTVVALDPDHRGAPVWRAALGRHENDSLTQLPAAGVVVYPGRIGGITTPPAYAQGVLYVPVIDWGSTFYPDRAEGLAGSPTSELVALSVRDGRVLWKHAFPSGLFGSVTVANDLALTSTYDGIVYAIDRETGEEVWRYNAGRGVNAPLTVVADTLLIPAGMGDAPKLIALKLPSR